MPNYDCPLLLLFIDLLTEMLGEKAQRFSRGMNRFIGFSVHRLERYCQNLCTGSRRTLVNNS